MESSVALHGFACNTKHGMLLNSIWIDRLAENKFPVTLQNGLMHVVPQKHLCDSHPEIAYNLTCSFRQIAGQNGTFSVDFYFRKPVNNILVEFLKFLFMCVALTVSIPIILQFKLTFARKINNKKGYSPLYGVKNLPIDICKVFRGVAHSNFMYLVTDFLKNYTNVLHPCPFTVSSSRDSATTVSVCAIPH